MLLKRATIKHYKSLDNVDVSLSPITVLVGPNGVGKSNFVDCLRFFRDAAVDGLEHAVIAREGIDRIRQNYKSRPYNISINLEFDAAELDGELCEYSLSLSGKDGEYRVEGEASRYVHIERLRDPNGQWVTAVGRGQFDRQRDGRLSVNGNVLERTMKPDVLALGDYIDFETLGGEIVDFVRGWSFCALYPNTLRRLGTPAKDDRLLEDGSNWASVVKALKRTKNGQAALERIAEVMRTAMPGYQNISVSTAGSYLVPQMTLSTLSEGSPRQQKFDPVQLSDGTLRVFGILLALYQQPPPPFLVIEEPEQTIHPGVLPALAEAFKEASERTQIVITTHSPQLVDQFDPENIRVVFSDGGLTRISPIKASQIEAAKERLMSLQEFMSAEGLLPEVAS